MVTHGIREELVKEVREGKGDLDGLSLEEVLRKDFKQWSEGGMVLGLAAVVKPLGYLVEKVGGDEEFLGGVKKWAEERDLGGGKKGVGLMGVMTTFSDEEGVFKRELFLWALSEGGEKAGRRFEEEAGEKLGLKAYEGGKWDGDGEDDVRWRRCWVQERTENSRKQVAPLLREAMK
ncbi:hypothetical protein GLAREA_08213 [Glarea lozoyensis ATCC 20868]|uniref:DHHA2 domain-containing protein n=1 Tax=Glarea lozoyensis (strain ATCC 20868 / MF5171) TaxID=1116229 RepID=S3CX23_GLAL2|nr:uncharacterized protein GLAREA_08213 [Glarea lozoyensis ATCC 20868]EPE24361.1 hypothetical protein GLAREA_08213 [Glarea lozoyensis ATCC 20868]